MRENADQNNPEYGHFLRSEILHQYCFKVENITLGTEQVSQQSDILTKELQIKFRLVCKIFLPKY